MDEAPKLFRLPGTIEEEEEEEKRVESRSAKDILLENAARAESPLLGQKGVAGSFSALPRNITLVRVNTQSSSIAGGVGRQDSTRSRHRAGPTRKLRRRAVLKNGECNVLQSRISRRSLRFLQDIFTTLVDTQWRWTLLCFSLSFILSWLGFAVIWWLIAFTHGDFEESHLPPFQVESNWTPCVYNIFSFTSCFLFSIENQHTIGFGSRSTTEECPEAIFIMCIQSISGVMIQAFMVGIVFAKMTRPKQRTQTLLFSRNAVICQRDGELCLMFRVGDMRKSHIIGASIRAQLIRTRTTKEGEVLSHNQQELVVGTDGQNGDLFFIWPSVIIHRINESSPFYNMSAEDMLVDRFEIVLILEGTIESTGQTTQARSSYLPQEILWGHRFDHMVSYSKERQGYEVDYSLFDRTTQVDTPLCSGRELAEFYRVQDEICHSPGVTFDKEHMAQQCWYRPMNQQRLKLPLAPCPLDSPKSNCSSIEYDWKWRNTGKIPISPNRASHGCQTENADQSREYDFDCDAIQVMEDVELEQLPEAVNREIVKNSEEIVFEEEEEEMLRKSLIKPYEERDGTWNNENIIFKGERENSTSPRASCRNLRANARNIPRIHEEDQFLPAQIEGDRTVTKSISQGSECKVKSDEISKKDSEICGDGNLTIQDQKYQVFSVHSKQRFSRQFSGYSLDDPFAESNGRRSFRKAEKDIIDRRDCEVSQEETSEKCDPFLNRQQKESTKKANDSFSDNSSMANNRNVFEQSEEYAVNSIKYIRMLEGNVKPSSPRRYLPMAWNQRSDRDPCEWENDRWEGRRDRGFKIVNEKARPSSRLAKITIQRNRYPGDLWPLVSPFSDLSPVESGFHEGNLSNLSPRCGQKRPQLIARHRYESADEPRRGSSSSLENNISRGVTVNSDTEEECAEVPIVKVSRYICENAQDLNGSRSFSSRSNLSQGPFIDEDSNSMKFGNPVVEVSTRTRNSIEDVDESGSSSNIKLPDKYSVDEDNSLSKCSEHRNVESVSHARNVIPIVDETEVLPSPGCLSYKHFVDENNSRTIMTEIPFIRVCDDRENIGTKISSSSNLSSKYFADDGDNPEESAENIRARAGNNIRYFVESSDDATRRASITGERIAFVNDEEQDGNGTKKERRCSKASSRKLAHDLNDTEKLIIT